MKRYLVFLALTGYCLSGFAGKPSSITLNTSEGRYVGRTVTLGYSKARIILDNGERMKIPLTEISSFTAKGKEFNRLPLYKNGKLTDRFVFMEKVCTRGELSLYKWVHEDTELILPYGKFDHYFVYNGDKLHVDVKDEDWPNISKFFNLKMVHN